MLPERLEPQAFAAALTAALDAGDVACLELRLAAADAAAWRAAIAVLAPIAQSRDVAFLLYGLPRLAADTGCDGVHVGADVPYGDARRAVGQGAIVGVSCGTSRHAAMEAGEAGADFIGFDPDPEIIAWWAELMEGPCVAFALGAVGDADVAALAAAGADFVAVREAVWDHPGGPPAGVAAMLAVLGHPA